MSGVRNFDLTGDRFGHLVVISQAERNPIYPTRKNWNLLCDCGNTSFAPTNILKKGEKTTCGLCTLHSIALSGAATHRGSKTKLYRVWYGMLERCGNKKLPVYKNYGARGISVCDSWTDSYESFRSWAESSGYEHGLSIERIDNNLGYCPSNCRWATSKEQAQNRRTNVLIEHDGMVKNMAQWENFVGLGRGVIKGRLSRGWSIGDAISTPLIKERGTQN